MHSRTRAARLAGALAIGVVVAGCSSGTEQGTPSPATTSSGPEFRDSAPNSAGGAVPKIPSSLDISRFVRKPCSALSDQVVRADGLSLPGKPNAKSIGASCSWENDDTAKFTLLLFARPGASIAKLYAGRNNGSNSYFEPTSVDGYPGIFSDVTDLRPSGTCHLYVGVNNSQVFSVTVGDFSHQSCQHAARVASTVLTTLKGQG